MTYYLIIFQVDTIPTVPSGPIKIKTDRHNYEIACADEKPRIDCPQGSFLVLKKYSFSIEHENLAFCVAEVQKLNINEPERSDK